MASVRNKDTDPELRVRRVLHRLGYRFRLHRKDLPGTPDIVLSRFCTVIFVHGCFWHGHTCRRGHLPESNHTFWRNKILGNKRRDKRTHLLLQRSGWHVIVVWQCQAKDLDRVGRTLQRRLERSSKCPEDRSLTSSRKRSANLS